MCVEVLILRVWPFNTTKKFRCVQNLPEAFDRGLSEQTKRGDFLYEGILVFFTRHKLQSGPILSTESVSVITLRLIKQPEAASSLSSKSPTIKRQDQKIFNWRRRRQPQTEWRIPLQDKLRVFR